MSGEAEVGRAVRWARRVLRLYPARFRRLYEDETLGAFRADAERGLWSAARSFVDLLLSLPLVHLRALVGRTWGWAGPGSVDTWPEPSIAKPGRGGGWIQDARLAARRARQNPGFATSVVLTMAVGIGAATVMFAAVHAVLQRPLPYHEPERLVRIHGTTEHSATAPVSLADALEWREAVSAFAGVAMYDLEEARLVVPDGMEVLSRAGVSSNFFQLLGVQARVGRLFRMGEPAEGGPPVAVLSHSTWVERFGGDPGTVGRTLVLDGQAHVVIGVLPRTFEEPVHLRGRAIRLYTLLDLDPASLVRDQHSAWAFARLAPGASVEQARRELQAVSADIRQRFPDAKAGRSARPVPILRSLVGDTGLALLTLLGAAGLLLAVACVNTGGLFLARGCGRATDAALRMALGASRAALLRQALVESVALSLLGTGGGIGGAALVLEVATTALSGRIPRIEGAGLAPPVMGFAVAAGVSAGWVFGALPAWRSVSAGAGDTLRAGGGRTGARQALRFIDGVAVAEVAVAVVLLVAAGLAGRSLAELLRRDTGFAREGVVAFRLSHPWEGGDAPLLYDVQRRLEERLAGLPGVQAVGAVNVLPLTGGGACSPFTVEGAAEPGEGSCAEFRTVTPGYARVMDLELLEGRMLGAEDDASAPAVVLVNRTMARRSWPGASPVGRRMKWGHSHEGGRWRTVVGVVDDIRHFGLAREPTPEVYMTFRQGGDTSTEFVVQAAGEDLELLAPAFRRGVDDVAPEAAISRIRTVEDLIRMDLAEPRLRAWLMGGFALSALILALAGVHAVLSFRAARRREEIGVRIALGARAEQVRWMVLGGALRITSVGVILGSLLAWGSTGVLENLLVDVSPTDPEIFGWSAGLVLVMAVAASWPPASRAARTDPAAVFRRG